MSTGVICPVPAHVHEHLQVAAELPEQIIAVDDDLPAPDVFEFVDFLSFAPLQPLSKLHYGPVEMGDGVLPQDLEKTPHLPGKVGFTVTITRRLALLFQ